MLHGGRTKALLRKRLDPNPIGYVPQSSAEAATESGTIVYFPPVSSGDSLFWVDKPRISQGRGKSATPEPGISIKDFNVRYEQDGEVPQYDRGAHAPLSSETSQENGVGEGVYLRVEKDAPRCWNCASYTHSARECPKPRDQEGRRFGHTSSKCTLYYTSEQTGE